MRRSPICFALLVPLLGLSLLAVAVPLAAEPCSECHEKKEIGAGSRSVHPPFAEDDCTACHAEHGDEERLVLAAAGNALCEDCHASADPEFLNAHQNIRGEKVGCISCHDPHRSDEEHLLLPNRHRPLAFGRCDACHRLDGKLHKPVRELCLGCHGGEEFSRRIVHQPVKRGECLACHDPHAARQPALLKARFAPGRWIGREGDVALCLGCHERQSLFSAAAATTHFRAGTDNLHALHVSASGPDRGARPRQSLSCRNCHEVHSAEEPRLVRRTLDCGGVPCLRLEFRRNKSGGQCLSGCHTPQNYAFASAPAPAAPPAPAPPAAPQRTAAALPEPSALERSINKSCVKCHEKAVKDFARAQIHAPVRAGTCSFCHLDHGPENRLILLDREDRICARCHDPESAASRTAHGGFALAGTRCTECHDPHSSASAAFLYERRHPPFEEADCGSCHGAPAAGWRISGNISKICRGCHDDIGGEKYPHPATAKGCLGCHRAHAAREKALLRAARPALCFTCHPRPRFAQETVHDPVGEGDCGACHPAHGAANEKLLSGPYPIEQYLYYDPGRYALCLECHDQGALTDPERGGDTGFTHGTRNLHALHLRDRVSLSELGTRVQPGITCRNCHDPHATEFPRLIRRVLDCNGVPCLKIEFKKIGAGGKCLGGCHISQSYLPADP